MSEGLRSTPPGSLLDALREEVVRLPNGFRDDDGVWYETGRRDRAVRTLDALLASQLRLAQGLRLLRDTSGEYVSNAAQRALDEAGVPEPPEEDHP